MNKTLAWVVVASTCLLTSACGTQTSGRSAAECRVEALLPEVDTGSAPRDRISTSNWMLILPVDAGGGTSGEADVISAAELDDGYSSDWFFATDDGGVAFWAPVNGATTPNSRFARSELREVIDPADPDTNWFVSGTATLTATLAVNQVPFSDNRIIVGKIVGHHAGESEYPSLLRLVLHLHPRDCRASLFALVADRPDPSAPSTQISLVDEAIRLNQQFSYSIQVSDGMLTLKLGATEETVAIDPRWADTPVYFMAGAALGTSAGDASDGASVTFYSLSASH